MPSANLLAIGSIGKFTAAGRELLYVGGKLAKRDVGR
jgi:hypothetical protein